MAADPDVTPLQIVRVEQAANNELHDPVTGLPFHTGSARLAVDLGQATLLLDKDQ